MQLTEYIGNTSKSWQLADGGGATKLGSGCALQLPGSHMILELMPGGKPYMDAYWYLALGPRKFNIAIYDLMVQFQTVTDYARCQGFEFEFRDDTVAEEEDGGWQADFNSGFWRMYDFVNQKWIQTKVGLPKSATWLSGVQIGAVYNVAQGVSASDGVMFHGLLVNGTWNSVEQLQLSVHTTSTPKFNMAVQLDGNEHGNSYSALVGMADLRVLG